MKLYSNIFITIHMHTTFSLQAMFPCGLTLWHSGHWLVCQSLKRPQAVDVEPMLVWWWASVEDPLAELYTGKIAPKMEFAVCPPMYTVPVISDEYRWLVIVTSAQLWLRPELSWADGKITIGSKEGTIRTLDHQ